jgi:hypothetical protein
MSNIKLLGAREQQFRIPGRRDGMSLSLRFLPTVKAQEVPD